MKKLQSELFFLRLNNKKERFPLFGQIELTYRCNLDCIHCYCKGLEDKNRELSPEEWKEILDEIQKGGVRGGKKARPGYLEGISKRPA